MLDGLETFMNNLINFDIDSRVKQLLNQDSLEIVKAIKAQLAAGIDGDGNKVYLMRGDQKHYRYALSTMRRKEKFFGTLSGVIDRITNYQSGAFYESIYLQVYDGDNFEVLSRDSKYELIKARSGEDIINLSPQSAQFLFKNEIAPELQAGINAIFFGKV